MKAKLSDNDKELFEQCQGHCSICLYEGGCYLQDKLKEVQT